MKSVTVAIPLVIDELWNMWFDTKFLFKFWV